VRIAEIFPPFIGTASLNARIVTMNVRKHPFVRYLRTRSHGIALDINSHVILC
jgi:hypothetical protein